MTPSEHQIQELRALVEEERGRRIEAERIARSLIAQSSPAVRHSAAPRRRAPWARRSDAQAA